MSSNALVLWWFGESQLDTLLVGCVVSGQSAGSCTIGILRTLHMDCIVLGQLERSGSSGQHSAYGLCSFRKVRRIPDRRDPPDTLLLGCS